MVNHSAPYVSKHGIASDTASGEDDEKDDIEEEKGECDALDWTSVAAIGKVVEKDGDNSGSCRPLLCSANMIELSKRTVPMFTACQAGVKCLYMQNIIEHRASSMATDIERT